MKKGRPGNPDRLFNFYGSHFYRTKVNPCGIKCGNTYAYIIGITLTIAASATECQNTNRKIIPSLSTAWVAAVATQIDCASINWPIAPPALLDAHIRIGLKL